MKPVKGNDALHTRPEIIHKIEDRSKVACDVQKSSIDVRRKALEFWVGDMVMLKVSPSKGMFSSENKESWTPIHMTF